MEQYNPLFIAFQQGYARRNSNNFSRDWDEFKTNHADLFQPPSPAKAEQEGPTQASLMLDELCELVFNDRLYGTSAGVSGRPHDPDPEISKVKRKILDLISTTPPVKEVEHTDDVETTWNTFWKDIVCNPDGTVSMEQVKKELHDFHFLMEQVPRVYEHITGGTLSKVMYPAQIVIQVADDHFNAMLKQELKDQNDDQEIDDQSIDVVPVKEAGQPRNLPIEELIKLSDEELNVEINKVRSRLGMGKSEEAGRSTDEDQYELYKAGYANGHRDGKREVSRLQPASSGFRWVPITQWGRVKRDITKVLVKYDTGEIRRFSEDDQPANLQTHFMDLSDSPAPVQVNLVAFANWIGEQAYYPDQISRNWAWEGCIPGQEITTECLLEKYIQSLQTNKP